MNSLYFIGLCDLVDPGHYDDIRYKKLLGTMFGTEFYTVVPDDENRVKDAMMLRKEFIRSDEPVTILEVTVALARRLAYIADSDDGDDNVPRWFWEMLENAGLDQFDDDSWFEMDGFEQVQMILRGIIERSYKRDGRGGYFPISPCSKDYRKEPLATCMNDYIRTRYFEEDK